MRKGLAKAQGAFVEGKNGPSRENFPCERRDHFAPTDFRKSPARAWEISRPFSSATDMSMREDCDHDAARTRAKAPPAIFEGAGILHRAKAGEPSSPQSLSLLLAPRWRALLRGVVAKPRITVGRHRPHGTAGAAARLTG
jgi:hypothetical protein